MRNDFLSSVTLQKAAFLSILVYFIIFLQKECRNSIARPVGGALNGASRRLQTRQSKQGYLTLPITYNYTIRGEGVAAPYTQLYFGTDKQPITLEVTHTHKTFVPLLPESQADFCNNATNARGCSLARTSGYYSPSDTARNETFDYFNPYAFISQSQSLPVAQGFWVEDLVTAGDVEVYLKFGVAEFWNATPVLGLGIWDIDAEPLRPSYLQALVQQGIIASPFVSFYQYTDPDASGSVLIGALDRDKFSGKLKVFSGDVPGVVAAPSLKVQGSPSSDTFNVSSDEQALIAPGLENFYLPQPILDFLLPEFPISTQYTFQDTGSYLIPCDFQIPDQQLELSFEDFVLKVPMAHLIIPVPIPAYGGLCFLALAPITDQPYGFNFSYIFGDPILRSAYVVVNPTENITALALSNPNITTENIVELGGSLGTSITNIVGNAPAATPNSPSSSGSGTNVGAIAGGVVGGVVLLAALAGLLFYIRRRKQLPPPAPAMPSPECSNGQPSAMELESQQGNIKSPLLKSSELSGNVTHSVYPNPAYSELPSPAPAPTAPAYPAYELPGSNVTR